MLLHMLRSETPRTLSPAPQLGQLSEELEARSPRRSENPLWPNVEGCCELKRSKPRPKKQARATGPTRLREDGMPGRNGQRKPGTACGSPSPTESDWVTRSQVSAVRLNWTACAVMPAA